MKTLIKSLILAVFLSSVTFVSPVLAYGPNLSAISQGNGSVLLTVNNANSNSQINLSSRQTSALWTVVNNIGQTDYSGNFSQVVSLPSDGSSNPIQVYVTVGGIQSQTVSVYANGGGCYGSNCGGCTYNCGTSGALTFSTTNPTLSVGQTSNVTIYSTNSNYSSGNYYNSSSYYISSNSNSNIVTASVSGQSLSLYGNSSGSSTIIVCQNNYSSVCGTLYVTVSGGTCYSSNCGSGSLTFSQSTVNVNVGQSASVTVYNNNGSLYVSSNSNSSAASVTFSGNQINIYGNYVGTASVSICSSYSSCGTLYITVGGSSGYGSVTLSQSTLNLSYPQTSTVTIYGSSYSGSYYISSNSNSSVANASVSGNSLYISSLTGGSTTVNVCQTSYSSQCASLYVTVSGGNGCYTNCGGGSISLSQSNVILNVGQNFTVTTYANNTGYLYVSSNTNPGVATASFSGNNIIFYGVGSGSTTFYICANSTSCAYVYVTVTGTYSGSNSLTFSPSSENLSLGQNATVYIYGTYSSGVYSISSNSNSGVVFATVSGSSVYLTANGIGSSNIVVCQNGSSSCGTLYVTVGGSGNYSQLSLSQSNLNINVGQTATVNASGNGGYGFFVGTNSNPGVVSATLTGSVINIYGLQNGTSNLQICQNNSNGCVTLYVSVGNNSGYNYGNGSGGGLQFPGGGNGSVLGASTYPNGELIGQNGTVYITYKNTITGFSSASVFTGLGFKFYNVVQVGNSGLNGSGYTVSTIYTSHPWGSWVKSGSTVYFVHDTGLIPIPNWSTFLNNGGSATLIVSANSYDLRLPILSPMVSGDPRLQ